MSNRTATDGKPVSRLSLALVRIDSCLSLIEVTSKDQIAPLVGEARSAADDAAAALSEILDLTRKF
jgi:hypothetical protein